MSAILTKTLRIALTTEGATKIAQEMLRNSDEYVPEDFTPVEVGKSLCMKVAADLVNLSQIEIGLQAAKELLDE